MKRLGPTTVAANGAPPAAAVTLYRGAVMHARLKPVGRRFAYQIFSVLLDLDRLAEADRASRLLSINRFNLFSVSEADHGPADGSGLRAWIDRVLAEAGLALPPHRVTLLCTPRILGHGFNPLAVYYCYDRSGAVMALVYEVRNTFGERHAYVAPVRPDEIGPEGISQDRDKLFYVSPFIPMAVRYRFRMLPPGERLRIRILEVDCDGPLLAATYVAEQLPLTSAALARTFLHLPFTTLKIVGAIHYEALRLWLKGTAVFRRPTPPPAISVAADGSGSAGPDGRFEGARRGSAP